MAEGEVEVVEKGEWDPLSRSSVFCIMPLTFNISKYQWSQGSR